MNFKFKKEDKQTKYYSMTQKEQQKKNSVLYYGLKLDYILH